MEFLGWTAAVYGEKSRRYRALLPKKKLWSAIDRKFEKLDEFYLRHPKFQNYPVVGVSYSQAKAYAQWRSNRVMELILYKNGVIEKDSHPTPETVFTIEKYFKGLYKGITPDPRFMKYPEYSLPDKAAYKKAFAVSNSVRKHLPKPQSVEFRAKLLLQILNNYTVQPSRLSGLIPEEGYANIVDLMGNVRELTKEKGVVYGNSYVDSAASLAPVFMKSTETLNVYTGFRNMCVYKKWKAN